jgi:hypothetical protein
MPTANLLDSRNLSLARRVRNEIASKLLYSEKCFKGVTLQVGRVKRVALTEITGLVAASEPADALFGRAVRK